MSDNKLASEMLLGERLQKVWKQQRDYNIAVKSVQTSIDDWSAVYLLGIAGEIGEVLKELNWKKHKRYKYPINRDNVIDELVDIFKFLMCLLQELDIGPAELLDATWRKSELIRAKLVKEFFPPSGRRVIVTDLDGTVADFRSEFAHWLHLTVDKAHSLSMDLDNDIPFGEYERMKGDFEASGGYARLPAYQDAVDMLQNEIVDGSFLFVATARPAEQYKRVPTDTMNWLSDNHISPHTILFGRDERVLELLELRGDNQVVLLEDDATLALRAANAGIPVMLRDQPYNKSAEHPLIIRYEKFPNRILWDELHTLEAGYVG